MLIEARIPEAVNQFFYRTETAMIRKWLTYCERKELILGDPLTKIRGQCFDHLFLEIGALLQVGNDSLVLGRFSLGHLVPYDLLLVLATLLQYGLGVA